MFPFVRLSRERAFTLIELLVVILIIGVLLSIALPAFLGQVQKAQDSGVQQQLAVARIELKSYWVSNSGSYCPSTYSGTDYEDNCTPGLISTVQASEPNYKFATAAGNGEPATTNQIALKIIDPNTALACEKSAGGTYFCLLANELGQNIELNQVAGSGPNELNPTYTDLLYGTGCTEQQAEEAMSQDPGYLTYDDNGDLGAVPADNTPQGGNNQFTTGDIGYFTFISDNNSNNWSDATGNCPATTTPSIPLNSFETAVLDTPSATQTPDGMMGALSTGGSGPAVNQVPWVFWRLQDNPNDTTDNPDQTVFDGSPFGRNGSYSASDGVTLPQFTLLPAPTGVAGDTTGPFADANGWALENDGASGTGGQGDDDDITDYQSLGESGPSTPSGGWALSAWVDMASSPAPSANTETNILAAQNASSDETIALTADTGGALGDISITTTHCPAANGGGIAGDNSAGPNSDGYDTNGDPLCPDDTLDAPSPELTTDIGTFSPDTWHFVVVTRNPGPSADGSCLANDICVYVDNVLAQAVDDSGDNASTDLTGGIIATDSVGDPTGISVSELAVYNQALSATDIGNQYTAAGF